MSCLPCFQGNDDDQGGSANNANLPVAQPKETPTGRSTTPAGSKEPTQDLKFNEDSERKTRNFTFRELAVATKNFRQESLLGEGAFGRIFKGTLKETGQIVAVRQLDRNGLKEGGQDFVLEVATLNYLEHKNLVDLIGYCADGEQRLLVYEYMPSGSLQAHLFDLPPTKRPLDWPTRMKIALGVADALQYLHENTDPQIIYRELKSSNIMLADDNTPKLSEYGLANLFQDSNNMMHTPRVISHGYRAPEYEKNGDFSVKSDVYSFGVIMLELITGRKAMDPSQAADEQNLVEWARPYFKDQSKFADLADPLLRGGFAKTSLNQAIGVAAMCIQEEPMARPFISDISAALDFLATAPPEPPAASPLSPEDPISQNDPPKKEDVPSSTPEVPKASDNSEHEVVESAKKKQRLRGKVKSRLKGLARKHKDKKDKKKKKNNDEGKDKKKKKLASKKSLSSSSIGSSSKTEESHDYDYGSSSDEEEPLEEEISEEEEEEEEEMSEEYEMTDEEEYEMMDEEESESE